MISTQRPLPQLPSPIDVTALHLLYIYVDSPPVTMYIPSLDQRSAYEHA